MAFSIEMGQELLRYCEALEDSSNPFCADGRNKQIESIGKCKLKAKITTDLLGLAAFGGASKNLIEGKLQSTLETIPDSLRALTEACQNTFNFFGVLGIRTKINDKKGNQTQKEQEIQSFNLFALPIMLSISRARGANLESFRSGQVKLVVSEASTEIAGAQLIVKSLGQTETPKKKRKHGCDAGNTESKNNSASEDPQPPARVVSMAEGIKELALAQSEVARIKADSDMKLETKRHENSMELEQIKLRRLELELLLAQAKSK